MLGARRSCEFANKHAPNVLKPLRDQGARAILVFFLFAISYDDEPGMHCICGIYLASVQSYLVDFRQRLLSTVYMDILDYSSPRAVLVFLSILPCTLLYIYILIIYALKDIPLHERRMYESILILYFLLFFGKARRGGVAMLQLENQ